MTTHSSSSSNPDSHLLARVRRGEDAAFAELFLAQYPAACEYAMRFVRERSVAEDLAQNVFARMLERCQTLQVDHSIRGYVLRAVRREALHYLRHERVVGQYSSQADDVEFAASLTPDAQSEVAELFALVEQAAATLSPRPREAFLLRWRYELRYEEIAEAMGISVKTVEMHLTRAVKVLRDVLTGYARDL